MRSRSVFWGVLLVVIGLLFVLRNFGVFYFSWASLWHLWPVILIILGIALLPVRSGIRIALSFLVAVIAVVWLTTTPRHYNDNWPWNRGWNDHRDYGYSDDDNDREWSDQLLYEDYNSDIQNAVLDLDAVAGEYVIDKTSDELIRFEREGNVGKYYLNADDAGSAVVLRLNMEGGFRSGRNLKNNANISLNPNPLWDIKVEAGAAKIDFDLSPFLVDRIDVDGGAMSVKIRLGDKSENTDVRINTGAAEVSLEVPRDVACDVEASTILSSKNLDGFDKIDKSHYRSEDYNNYQKKITINIEAALSSLRVVRY